MAQPKKTTPRKDLDLLDDVDRGPGAAMRALLDEQKRTRRGRRRKILFVGAAAGISILYLAVTTFVFNPLETSVIAFQNAVPRACDFFLRKKDLSDDLPLPATAITPLREDATLWKPIEEGKLLFPKETVRDLVAGYRDLEAAFAEVPLLDPVRDLVGSEVVLAGLLPDKGGVEGSRFGLYLRVSWRVRAAFGLLRYGFVRGRLLAGIPSQDRPQGVLQITPPGLGRSLFLARRNDLLVVASDEAWIQESFDLLNDRGQGSFGQSSMFNDEIATRLRDRTSARSDTPSNAQVFLRVEKLRALIGAAKTWPQTTSPLFEERLLANVFSTGMIRDVAALVRFESRPRRSIVVDAFFDIDVSMLDPAGQRLFTTRPLTSGDLTQAAQMTPQSAFLGGIASFPGGEVARLVESSMAPQDRQIPDDALRRTGKYTSTRALVDDFDLAVGDRTIVVARENVYPPREKDPDTDHGPEPAVAFSFPQRSPERIGQLIKFFSENKQYVGIEQSYTWDVSGHRGQEFYSILVPGTGEIAVLAVGRDTRGELIVSNQARLIDNVHSTWRLTATFADKPYAQDALFSDLFAEPQDEPVNLMVWGSGPKLARALQKYVDHWVRMAGFGDVEQEKALRPGLFAQALREKYPQFRPDNVPPKERAEVDEIVDRKLAERRQAAAKNATPQVRQEYQEMLRWLDAVPGALATLRLEKKHASLYFHLALE